MCFTVSQLIVVKSLKKKQNPFLSQKTAHDFLEENVCLNFYFVGIEVILQPMYYNFDAWVTCDNYISCLVTIQVKKLLHHSLNHIRKVDILFDHFIFCSSISTSLRTDQWIMPLLWKLTTLLYGKCQVYLKAKRILIMFYPPQMQLYMLQLIRPRSLPTWRKSFLFTKVSVTIFTWQTSLSSLSDYFVTSELPFFSCSNNLAIHIKLTIFLFAMF